MLTSCLIVQGSWQGLCIIHETVIRGLFNPESRQVIHRSTKERLAGRNKQEHRDAGTAVQEQQALVSMQEQHPLTHREHKITQQRLSDARKISQSHWVTLCCEHSKMREGFSCFLSFSLFVLKETQVVCYLYATCHLSCVLACSTPCGFFFCDEQPVYHKKIHKGKTQKGWT